MKIIDLLVKIAKREEVPKKISVEEEIYYFSYNNRTYYNFETSKILELPIIESLLNTEVEIIEEEKKIPEKIEEKEIEVSMAIGEQICANKINEIIDYLKENNGRD